MATQHGLAGWRGSHRGLDSKPAAPPQQSSASDLLQSYIERFDRSGEVVGRTFQPLPSPEPASTTHSVGGSWEKLLPQKIPISPPQPPSLLPLTEDDAETLELLCGWRGTGDCLKPIGQSHTASSSDAHVSVRTRRILQDVDKQLGHWQPCYSAPDKLDLRTKWPSMHEHLERRWRQQIRARYEARQLEEAEALAKAKAVQGSRADLYSWTGVSGRHGRTLPLALPKQKQQQPKEQQLQQQPKGQQMQQLQTRSHARAAEAHDVESNDEEDNAEVDDDLDEDDGVPDDDTEKAESVDNDAAEAAVRSESEEEEEEEEVGRPWGSDSGLGLSCTAAREKQLPPTSGEKLENAPSAPATAGAPESAASGLGEYEDEASERRSFEERMRSYRCVLEAHELSAQLRQRLEVACAVGGGPRALTADQKGRIRDRLARLQHPDLAIPEAALADSPRTTFNGEEQQRWPQRPRLEVRGPVEQQQPRITTERLTRLMSSARSLLAQSDGRLTSCSRLCDSLTIVQQQQQQPQQQQKPGQEQKAPANVNS